MSQNWYMYQTNVFWIFSKIMHVCASCLYAFCVFYIFCVCILCMYAGYVFYVCFHVLVPCIDSMYVFHVCIHSICVFHVCVPRIDFIISMHLNSLNRISWFFWDDRKLCQNMRLDALISFLSILVVNHRSTDANKNGTDSFSFFRTGSYAKKCDLMHCSFLFLNADTKRLISFLFCWGGGGGKQSKGWS